MLDAALPTQSLQSLVTEFFLLLRSLSLLAKNQETGKCVHPVMLVQD